MRSAAQLVINCWLDEELRLGVVRVDGVISNIESPLGEHDLHSHAEGLGPHNLQFADMHRCSYLLPLPLSLPHSISPSATSPASLSISSSIHPPLLHPEEVMNAVATDSNSNHRSSAVSRLSAAILQSRFIDHISLGNVPLHIRSAVLEKDIRYATLLSTLLCYAILCYAMICSALHCTAMIRYAMHCYALHCSALLFFFFKLSIHLLIHLTFCFR